MERWSIPDRRGNSRITAALFICSLVILDIAARYETRPLRQVIPQPEFARPTTYTGTYDKNRSHCICYSKTGAHLRP
jgi:hypothetical protein